MEAWELIKHLPLSLSNFDIYGDGGCGGIGGYDGGGSGGNDGGGCGGGVGYDGGGGFGDGPDVTVILLFWYFPNI